MKWRFRNIGIVLAFTSCLSQPALAEAPKPDPEFDEILARDLAEFTVTSVSKKAQKLQDAAAAIYVITQEDLHRSGVTSIPEALRMVPGIQVAQVASNQWAVSARGFNNLLANKLLVLIDGRTVYTPVYSGTYWDNQDTLIEDIERIEVIRGPGASLWGANAVNGVINIITKKAADTQGNYLATSVGTEEYNTTEGRQGGKIGNDTFFRTYAKYFHRGKTERETSGDNIDNWHRLRSGFRVDGKRSEQDSYTVQGDVFGGQQHSLFVQPLVVPPFTISQLSEDHSLGGNLLGRWNHTLNRDSATSLQVYADNYTRNETLADQSVSTFDIDFQHNLKLNDRNDFVWGLGYRFVNQRLEGGTTTISFADEHRNYDTLSAFAQDQYALVPEKLFFTLGSKFEHNDFTGFEFQPTARLSWLAAENQTVWASVSRAVRIPSGIEDDLNLAVAAAPTPGGVGLLSVFGNKDLKAEELIAYELGYRVQPTASLSLDSTVFYNDYANLTTFEQNSAPFFSNGTLVIPYSFDDLGKGRVYGFEVAANYNVTKEWKLAASYSLIRLSLDVEPQSTFSLNGSEDETPNHQIALRSYYNILSNLQWDNMLYYTDGIELSNSRVRVSDYTRLDSRLGWEVTPGLEISVIGRNLLDAEHIEFSGTPNAEIERSVLGQVSWKF